MKVTFTNTVNGNAEEIEVEAKNFALGYRNLFLYDSTDYSKVIGKPYARKNIDNLVIDGEEIPTHGDEFKRINCWN